MMSKLAERATAQTARLLEITVEVAPEFSHDPFGRIGQGHQGGELSSVEFVVEGRSCFYEIESAIEANGKLQPDRLAAIGSDVNAPTPEANPLTALS